MLKPEVPVGEEVITYAIKQGPSRLRFGEEVQGGMFCPTCFGFVTVGNRTPVEPHSFRTHVHIVLQI
jgi:hypothetical protein